MNGACQQRASSEIRVYVGFPLYLYLFCHDRYNNIHLYVRAYAYAYALGGVPFLACQACQACQVLKIK